MKAHTDEHNLHRLSWSLHVDSMPSLISGTLSHFPFCLSPTLSSTRSRSQMCSSWRTKGVPLLCNEIFHSHQAVSIFTYRFGQVALDTQPTCSYSFIAQQNLYTRTLSKPNNARILVQFLYLPFTRSSRRDYTVKYCFRPNAASNTTK